MNVRSEIVRLDDFRVVRVLRDGRVVYITKLPRYGYARVGWLRVRWHAFVWRHRVRHPYGWIARLKP